MHHRVLLLMMKTSFLFTSALSGSSSFEKEALDNPHIIIDMSHVSLTPSPLNPLFLQGLPLHLKDQAELLENHNTTLNNFDDKYKNFITRPLSEAEKQNLKGYFQACNDYTNHQKSATWVVKNFIYKFFSLH